jgi:hypothetical protein
MFFRKPKGENLMKRIAIPVGAIALTAGLYVAARDGEWAHLGVGVLTRALEIRLVVTCRSVGQLLPLGNGV